MDFKKILAVVLGVLGVKAIDKNAEGKSALTTEMETKLKEEFGEKFLEKFKKELALEDEKGTTMSLDDTEVNANAQAVANMQKKLDAALSVIKKKDAAIALLEKDPEPDNAEQIDMSAGAGKVVAFKPNMAYTHNKVVADYFRTGVMQYSGDDTINTTELQTEFGKYISGQKLDILKSINLGLTITDYMTTIVTDKFEWRATKATMTSVLQQFTPKWTPKGSAEFTPITVKSFPLKVNVPITPSDIIDGYLGYLYDEDKTPDQMPIVPYIVNELVLPKLLEDLELAMATGKFVEHLKTQDGQEGSDAEDSMDGVLTTLAELKKGANEITWLLNGIILTDANILAKMDEVVDKIPYRYKKKAITIHADPDLIVMYGRAYRKLYPTSKNQDGEQMKLDFSKLTFAPVDGFSGTKCFVITPKENFIHLQSRDVASARIFMQVQNYDVKVFMEFRKGAGFAIQEAIFAYLPASFVEGESVLEPGSVGGGI